VFKKLLVAVVVLGAAYVGGSYYVGYRAEQQLVAMMNDAQARADNELVWEQVEIKHGVFTSTGSMVLVLKQMTFEDQHPVQTQIDYIIHHHLHWSRVAHFVWQVTPDDAFAKQIESLYPQTPSLTGDGMLDWSGVATSTIAFPGIDNVQSDHGLLTVAPLSGSISAGNNAFDLKLDVAQVSLIESDSPARVQLNNLSYEARSSDVASGSVALTFLAGDALLVSEDGESEALNDYRWHFDALYQDNLLSLDTQKTIGSINVMGNQASDVEVSLGLDGLDRKDLTALASLVNEIDGQWFDITEQQLSRAQQLALDMLARGLTVRVPAIKADIQFLGDDVAQTVGLEGFSLSARLVDPDNAEGQIHITLGALTVPAMFEMFAPQVRGFDLKVTNEVTDGITNLSLKKSLDSYAQHGQTVSDVEVDLNIQGFAPSDLLTLIDIAQSSGGDLANLSLAQQTQLTQLLQDATMKGLTFTVPVFKGTVVSGEDAPDSLRVEGLELQVKLDDPATGAGNARLGLTRLSAQGPLMVEVPQIEDYQVTVTNQVTDGKSNYQIDKSIKALQTPMVNIGSSTVALRLNGLDAKDLQRASEIFQAKDGELDEQQRAELTQIARRAVASGFEFAIPKLQLEIDSTQIEGQALLSLTGLGSAPLASFDLARLAQLQAELKVEGQSAWLAPLVQQGLMMGLLAVDANVVKGNYQFMNGELVVNGMTVPAGEFVLMANLMVQQMLAQTAADRETGTPDARSDQRQRRNPSGQ
jgi:uncharacterized protein YdgA (DUF945 family)